MLLYQLIVAVFDFALCWVYIGKAHVLVVVMSMVILQCVVDAFLVLCRVKISMRGTKHVLGSYIGSAGV